MKPTELYFSIAHYSEYEYGEIENDNDDNRRYVAFCPIEYWDKHKCLPDYYYADKMADIAFPVEYAHYPSSEETQYVVNKPKAEIIKELTEMGFKYNPKMESFLLECWE